MSVYNVYVNGDDFYRLPHYCRNFSFLSLLSSHFLKLIKKVIVIKMEKIWRWNCTRDATKFVIYLVKPTFLHLTLTTEN
jgi:hypothetical protein